MDFPPEPDDGDFNFSFDHKDEPDEYADEILEKKVDSLGWKVTVIAIIIPCLIGVVAALSYYSITRKVTEFQDTGSATVQQFSRIYEDKLTEMQEEMAAQQEAVEKKLAVINQNASAIKNNRDRLVDNQKTIQGNQNAIKTTQDGIKALTAADGKTAAAIDGIQQDLEKLTEAVGETSRQVLALRQKLETIESRLSGLAEATAQKPDMGTIEGMLAELENKFRPSVDASAEAVRARLKIIEDRLTALERKTALFSPDSASGPGSPAAPPGDMKIIEEENLR